MPLLVDGNNLLHRLPPGRRSRAEVRRQVLDLVRHESMQVVVVFDGPPPDGGPASESLGRATVLYSGSLAADDVILNRLAKARAARDWVVVTDDRGLESRARHLGAAVRRLASWHGQRRRSRATRIPQQPGERFRAMTPAEIADWESAFEGRRESHDDDGAAVGRPSRVRRRKRRRAP